jgi:hypothetical protein
MIMEVYRWLRMRGFRYDILSFEERRLLPTAKAGSICAEKTMSAKTKLLEGALGSIRSAVVKLKYSGNDSLADDLDKIAEKVFAEMEHMKAVENHPDLFKN